MGFGGKSQSTTDKRLNAITINQSSYGNVIPLIYGKCRVPMMLGWYDSFVASPHTQDTGGGKGGGGGSSHTSYTYSAAMVMILCEGQITDINTVWKDKEQSSLGAEGLTLFFGAGGQPAWSYLTTNFPSQAIAYDHTAYVASGSYQLGDSPGLPNLTFEVRGFLQYNAGTIDDAEPSAVLIDYCTDANHGCAFPYLGSLQGVGATTYQTYCIAMGFFISPEETTQRQARDFIDELLKTTNSEAVWSSGLLKIVPYQDASVTGNGRTYTPDLTPIFSFSDDDYISDEDEDPVRVTRKAQADTFNRVRVEFLDRTNQYNTAIAEATDANDIALNGERTMQTINLHAIKDYATARLVAQLILQRQLYVRNTFEFAVRVDFCLLEPMDLVSISDSTLGISNQLVRITEVSDDEEDKFTITAEEMLVGTASAPRYNWELAQGYAANYAASPGSINSPAIINAPAFLADDRGEYELWIAVSAAGAQWGGCNVYASFDDVKYQFAGTIYGQARYGTLTASLASGSDPDTSHTLAILLNNTALTIASATTADADLLRSLIYVDGEIMSYRDATLTGAGAYNVNYLRRGKYGSTNASHSSGTQFIRLDGAIFKLKYDPGAIGQTVYLKFASFNVYGKAHQSLSGVTAYSHVLLAQTSTDLKARGDCVATPDMLFKKTTGSPAWDSDIYSTKAFANGCFVSFQAAQTSGADFMLGLNSDPTTDQNYTSLDYAWRCADNGQLLAYESGSNVVDLGTGSYTTGTKIEIKYDGQNVQYFKDGTLIRQVYNPGKTFFVDSSWHTPGSAAKNFDYGPLTTAPTVPFIARGNCIATATTIQKLGGSSAWDSDCYSKETYAGGCYVKFQPSQTNLAFIIGFNSDPTSDQDYLSIDYGWMCYLDGTASIYESGVQMLNHGAYAATDVFTVKYDGQRVLYYSNDTLVRSVPLPDGPAFFTDSSFYSPGAAANNIEFGPLTTAPSIPFIARGNCVATATTIQKNGGSAAYDSDCYSFESFVSGCYLSFQPNQTNGFFFIGLNSDPTTDQNYTSLDFAWLCVNDATLRIYENGSDTGATSASYTTDTVLKIKYDGQNVQYFKDGVLIRSTPVRDVTLFLDSSFNTPGAAARNVEFGALTTAPSIPWITRGNCVATKTTAQKLGGSSAWDSDVYSVEAYEGGCIVSFQPNQTNAYLVLGLNSDPTTDENYTSIDFGWTCINDGTLRINESGIDTGATTASYTTDTVLSIKHDGQRILYFMDGVLIRTVPGVTSTLFMDSSWFTPGAAVRNLDFSPANQVTPVPFIARGNCVVHDTSARKVGGSSAFDSDIISIQGFANGHLTFKASQTNLSMGIGIDADPYSNFDLVDIMWAPVSSGDAYIIENGSIVTNTGAYTIATVFAITFDGTYARYYKDSVLIRTVSYTASPAFLHGWFYHPDTEANSINFGPGATIAHIDTVQLGDNAATIIYSTTATQDVNIPTGYAVNVASLSIPPQIVDTEMIVTGQGTCDLSFASPGTLASTCFGHISDTDESGTAIGTTDRVIENSQSPGGTRYSTSASNFSQERRFIVPIGTAKTFYFAAAEGGLAGSIFNVTVFLKVEVIRR